MTTDEPRVDNTLDYESNGPAHAEEPEPRRRRSYKGWIVAGVIVAVVVAAGIGFWIWHEQPSFCNAICHSPMDYYVDSYYSGENPQQGIYWHAAAGETCLSCHIPTLTEQATEVLAWVSDTYPMTPDGQKLASGKQFASEEFCAREGCHAMGNNMNEITANTWGFWGNEEKYNPHSSHQSSYLKCYDCHGIHETNILVCNECHDLKMSAGWEAPNNG